jgi:hypothetical protein
MVVPGSVGLLETIAIGPVVATHYPTELGRPETKWAEMAISAPYQAPITKPN